MHHPLVKKSVGALVAALAVTTMITLTACSAGTAQQKANPAPNDGTLTVGLLNDIGQPPDPDVYYANNGLAIVLNAYEGLVQYKNDAESGILAPRLAESWTVSKDNTVYTFKLRPGVKFHDGTPFTSEAVKVSFARRLSINGGAAYMVQGIKSVATPDPLTAVVTLKAPNAAFLDYLASPFSPKMESPTGLAKNAGSDNAQTYLQTHDLGTGPYELTAAQVGTKYTMTQFPGYWGTKSPFTTIQLPVFNDVSSLQLAINHGDVSVSVANLPSSSLSTYANSKAFNSYMLPTFQAALVFTNPSKPFFATVAARQAFLQSIDKQKLVTEVLGARSTPATTLYAKGVLPVDLNKQSMTYKPSVMADYAKTLPKGTSLVIGYASDSTNAQQMANIVSAQLLAAGIHATAQSYPTSQIFAWASNPSKGPDAFIDGNNGPDGGNPYMWGHVFWDKTGGINYFGCDDPSTDADLNQAVQTGSNDLFAKAAKTYESTGCYMTLSDNRDWVVSQKWLQGVPQAHNIGANELDYSKLSIKK
ncbi:ABC transporter substrate-binding protein [Diaminobutyricibacter tongyongensis]|uniref:ABC transporter substrate-binding protein n=1 Tax=Leifsonia tongyongensis TaxID=1268043 RepID=A0A6L9Y0R8_9MICO|nr:ABC transporter substrate-binding protein [Diaminobutyricibacter tongyongensis]